MISGVGLKFDVEDISSHTGGADIDQVMVCTWPKIGTRMRKTIEEIISVQSRSNCLSLL
jgi:hypothetical protein